MRVSCSLHWMEQYIKLNDMKMYPRKNLLDTKINYFSKGKHQFNDALRNALILVLNCGISNKF